MGKRVDTARRAARVSLAVVVLLAGLMALPRPASRVVASDAHAQPAVTPLPTSLPNLTASPSPSPSPSKTDDGGGSKDPDGEKDKDDDKRPTEKQRDADKKANKKVRDLKERAKKGKKGKRRRPGGGRYVGTFRPTGSFTTDGLVAIASNLRALGWESNDVVRKVYAPFIIGGTAAWTNTWGAPRYGPGPLVRKHEGQDVFCNFGAPVLASEAGTIEFDQGGLGGKVARLYRPDGSYWYYAHLSDWNTDEFASGDRVRPGDVLGYCGNTGNAISTPPHVHFGWYQPNDKAKDPHWALKRWLATAEDRAANLLVEVTAKRVEQIDRLTVARRFGDGFAPDLIEFSTSGEALWGWGSSPTSGAFTLAEAALHAALSDARFQPGSPLRRLDLDAQQAGRAGTDDALLEEMFASSSESGD